jgi:fimbrial chaperone protein
MDCAMFKSARHTPFFGRLRHYPAVFLVALVAAALLASPARAYEVTPMRIFLQPERGQTSATITINNVRDAALPVEILVLRRLVAPDGEQTFEPADEQFIVFPPQVQIEAGQSQAIRIQFAGNLGNVAEAYVVQVTEVPVNRLEGTGIQFTYNFGVAVYLQPSRARARMSVTNPVISDGSLHFEVVNSGNDFGFLTGQGLEYRIGGKRVTISPDDLGELVSNPIVPPNSSRQFILPLGDAAEGAAALSGPAEVRLLRNDN